MQNLRRTRSIQAIVADQFERHSKRGELEEKQETEYRSSSQSEKNQVLGESWIRRLEDQPDQALTD